MTRFTRLQYWQLIVFCLYWFVFFPLIWFLLKPTYFASSILKTILLALLLLIVYISIYILIDNCCCQNKNSTTKPKRFWSKPSSSRGADNPVYGPTTTSKNDSDHDDDDVRKDTRVSMPDAVMFENVPRIHKPGLVCHEEPLLDEENKNVRFITSCSLYYDGHDFHDT